MATEIDVSLTLRGDAFEPDTVTDITSLIPTHTWRKGDLVPGTTMKRKEDGWRISTGLVTSNDLDEQITHIIDLIAPFASKIRHVCQLLDLDVDLSCVVYIDPAVPSMSIDLNTMGMLVSVGATIDIDVYVLSFE